jgi:hypothetical protein
MFIAKVLLEDSYGTHSNASVCLAESDAIFFANTSTFVPRTHDPGLQLQPTKLSLCPHRILQHERGVLRFTAAHTLKRTLYIPTLEWAVLNLASQAKLPCHSSLLVNCCRASFLPHIKEQHVVWVMALLTSTAPQPQLPPAL